MGNLTSLGGALPLLTQTISGVKSFDRTVNGNRNADQQLKLLGAQQAEKNRLDEKIADARAATDTSILNATQNDETRRRASALKRALSRQRAIFGGSGIDRGGDDGSGEAIVSGLLNESEQDQTASDSIFNLRRRIIEDNVQNIRARNLLEESQFNARRKIKSAWLS